MTKQAAGGQMTHKVLPVRWNDATMAHEARCPDCRQLAFMLTREATAYGNFKVPFLAPHECPGPACTCKENPYDCPQGHALVASIHKRKQGD